jgi:ZIP family zinc transporter
MLDALLLGGLAQSALVLTGLVVYVVSVPRVIVGSIAGYGIGALLGAIAFDLIPESSVLPTFESAIWLLAGAAVFIVADWFVETRLSKSTASDTDKPSDPAASEEGSGQGPLGIVVGSIVDGVPESLIFGIGVATAQPLSIPFLAAVWISNIPQALAPSAELAKSGWKVARMTLMWGGVVIACGIASGLGFLFASLVSDVTGGRAAAFAAGGLLAMLTNSLVPFAYQRAGAWAGIFAVVGFALAVASSGM